MKKLKIFLASSIVELKEERNEIGDFIRRIQDELIDMDYRIQLFECEFFDNSIALTRKQDEYNDEIEKSDIFVMLVGSKLGNYTFEEFKIAKSISSIEINVIFKNYLEHIDETVSNFKRLIQNEERVNQYEYTDLPGLKYAIAQIIAKNIPSSLLYPLLLPIFPGILFLQFFLHRGRLLNIQNIFLCHYAILKKFQGKIVDDIDLKFNNFGLSFQRYNDIIHFYFTLLVHRILHMFHR